MSGHGEKINFFIPEIIMQTDDGHLPAQSPEPCLNEITPTQTPVQSFLDSPHMTAENIAKMNEFARLPPDELIKKITSMQDEIYKLGLREAQEISRGRKLGIFERSPFKKEP